MGLAKMRARRTPANQAHVTNRKEHPALLAADAAEAALRGFAEIETTVAVARYAPFNALAILVGSQTGRGGVLTQCAVEEAINLRLGFKGLTTYCRDAVGLRHRARLRRWRRHAVVEGLPGVGLCSRGVKIRFTSGTGSEALMGHARGQVDALSRSALPAGRRGRRQPGRRRTARSPASRCPNRCPAACAPCWPKTCIAMLLGLEVASGNDALASHSDIRKTAKLMLQFIPGTDFITSGLQRHPAPGQHVRRRQFRRRATSTTASAPARHAGSTAASRPCRRSARCSARERAARALQAVFAAFGFPPITDDEIAAATRRLRQSEDMPDRDAWPTSTPRNAC